MNNQGHTPYEAVSHMPDALGWHGLQTRITALQSGFVAQAFLLEVDTRQAFVKCYDRQRAITERMLRSNEFALPVSAWAHDGTAGHVGGHVYGRHGALCVRGL